MTSEHMNMCKAVDEGVHTGHKDVEAKFQVIPFRNASATTGWPHLATWPPSQIGHFADSAAVRCLFHIKQRSQLLVLFSEAALDITLIIDLNMLDIGYL
jgi:hypothetical protein